MQLTNLLTTLLLTISLTLLPLTIATPGSPTPPISIASSLLPAASAAYNSALSSYAHTKTAAPEWSSAMNELYFYQMTGKNVPDFTATAWDSDVTTAAWYKAMPTDLKKYFDQEEKEQAEIWTSVVKKVTSGAAARPTNAGICVGSALALLVAGITMAL